MYIVKKYYAVKYCQICWGDAIGRRLEGPKKESGRKGVSGQKYEKKLR